MTLKEKRAKRLVRSRASLERRTRVKRVNRKRRAKERLRANGSEAYKNWLHEQPCAVCGWVGNTIEAHAKTGGGSRKADAELTLPMCGEHFELTSNRSAVYTEGCHNESHRGVKSFEKKHGVSLVALAKQTQEQYAEVVVARMQRQYVAHLERTSTP